MQTTMPIVLIWAVVSLLVLGAVGFGGTHVLVRALLSELHSALEATYVNALGSQADDFGRLRKAVNHAKDRTRLISRSATATLIVAALDWVFPVMSVFFSLAAAAFAIGALARALLADGEIAKIDGALGAVVNTRKRILETIGDDKIDQATLIAHARVVRDEERFRQTLGTPFEVKYLELGEVGIFRDLAWNFEPGMNVLLGRNGFGKSFLLRLLVATLTNETDRLTQLTSPSGGQRMLVHLLRNSEPTTIERKGLLLDCPFGKIPVLAIPDSRFINRARNSVSTEGDDYSDLARFGAYHFLWDLSYETTIQTVLAQMCIDALGRGTGPGPPASPQLDLVSELVKELSGENFRFDKIEPAGSARFSILVETDASPGRPISIQQASQGTLSVIAMCALIYQFLRAVHPGVAESELCKQRAIVVIDEVDAHLHPAWQRKIAFLFRKHFPQVQFIVTAHSPLVVAGCGPGEVSVLRREGKELKVLEFQKGFVGARPEDIYKEVFEIEERDAAFLGLQAQLPTLPLLQRDLENLKTSSSPDKSLVRRMEETIDSITRTKEDEEQRIEYDSLVRENEQLRRQLEAERKRSVTSKS